MLNCIIIKSGENMILQNCTMRDGSGTVKIGGGIAGRTKNVFIENCKMSKFKPNRDAEQIFSRNVGTSTTDQVAIER